MNVDHENDDSDESDDDDELVQDEGEKPKDDFRIKVKLDYCQESKKIHKLAEKSCLQKIVLRGWIQDNEASRHVAKSNIRLICMRFWWRQLSKPVRRSIRQIGRQLSPDDKKVIGPNEAWDLLDRETKGAVKAAMRRSAERCLYNFNQELIIGKS